MLSDSIATLIRAEQARQEGQFVDVTDLDGYLAKLAEKAEFVSDAQGDRCRGFVAFYCNDVATMRAYITLVLVAPEDRGRGIGRALVGRVMELARSRGFTSCALEVESANTIAQAMYGSLGFQPVATRDRKILMEAPLG